MKQDLGNSNKNYYKKLCVEFLFSNAYRETTDYRKLYDKRNKEKIEDSTSHDLNNLIKFIQYNQIEEIEKLIDNKIIDEIKKNVREKTTGEIVKLIESEITRQLEVLIGNKKASAFVNLVGYKTRNQIKGLLNFTKENEFEDVTIGVNVAIVIENMMSKTDGEFISQIDQIIANEFEGSVDNKTSKIKNVIGDRADEIENLIGKKITSKINDLRNNKTEGGFVKFIDERITHQIKQLIGDEIAGEIQSLLTKQTELEMLIEKKISDKTSLMNNKMTSKIQDQIDKKIVKDEITTIIKNKATLEIKRVFEKKIDDEINDLMGNKNIPEIKKLIDVNRTSAIKHQIGDDDGVTHEIKKLIKDKIFSELKGLIGNKEVNEIKKQFAGNRMREIENLVMLSFSKFDDDKRMNAVLWANILQRTEILNYIYDLRWNLEGVDSQSLKKNSIGKSQLYWALACKQKQALQLIDKEKNSSELENAFYTAAFYGSSADVIDKLIKGLKNKISPEKLQVLLDSALCGAAENGHLSIVEKLITQKANVNARHEGKQPLWLASRFGHKEVVKKLLESGAKIEQKDLIDLKKSKNSNIKKGSNIFKNDSPKMESANIEQKENSTALFAAAAYGQIDVVELLIQNKADLNSEDINGLTPFMIAVKKSHNEIAEVLIDKKVSIDKADLEGETSLFYAVRNNDIEMIDLLCKHGADINHLNKKDQKVSNIVPSLKLESSEKAKLGDHLALWEAKMSGKDLNDMISKVLDVKEDDQDKSDSDKKNSPRFRRPSLTARQSPFTKLKGKLAKNPSLEELKTLFLDEENKSIISETKCNFILQHILEIQLVEKKKETDEKVKKGRKPSLSSRVVQLFKEEKKEEKETDKGGKKERKQSISKVSWLKNKNKEPLEISEPVLKSPQNH